MSSTFRQLDEYATSTGQIPLTLGDLGFYVHADFFNYNNKSSDTNGDNSDYGNMAIALYTDQTYFGQACQGFQDYCQDGKHDQICQSKGESNHSVFPYFESDSYSISSEVFMDYNHWFLKSPALYSNSCSGSYAFGGYGLIGMGASSFSLPNFDGKNPNFAVHIAKNLSNGTLAFNVDLNNVKSTNPSATLITNNVWHIEKVDAIDMKKKTFDANASLIFDLASDSICFPKRLYDQVLHYLEASPQIGQCSIGDDSRPTCEFTGDIRHLPSIKILVGDETIEIPPEVYVVQTQNTTFYYDPIMLKIRSLSDNVTSGSKDVPVTTAYKDTIILGYPVMSYYYTVFEAGQNGEGTVNLYLSGDYVSASSLTWIFVVAGVLGLLLIGATFYIFERKYRKNRELEQPLMGSEAVKARGFVGKGKRIQDSQEV